MIENPCDMWREPMIFDDRILLFLFFSEDEVTPNV